MWNPKNKKRINKHGLRTRRAGCSKWHQSKMTWWICVTTRLASAKGPKYSVFRLRFLMFSKFSMPNFLLIGILFSVRLQSSLEDPEKSSLKYISIFVFWLIILYVLLNHVLSIHNYGLTPNIGILWWSSTPVVHTHQHWCTGRARKMITVILVCTAFLFITHISVLFLKPDALIHILSTGRPLGGLFSN